MTQLVNVVDFVRLSETIDSCCKTVEECGTCQSHQCLIGFCKTVTKYATTKNIYLIPNGEELVPRNDYKVFENETLVGALAETCFQCKNCQDNHDTNCSVSLIRNSLENALLGQNVPYLGSSGLYIMEIAKLNQTIGGELMENFQRLKGTR